jgi:hypothetical protein
MALIEEPLLTFEFEQGEFFPESGSAYIYGSIDEERAELDEDWHLEAAGREIALIRITGETPHSVQMQLGDGAETVLSLRSTRAVQEFVGSLPSRVYLDVTALSHPTWAVLLRGLIDSGKQHAVVYTEPADYRRDQSPAQGMVYDLSERISGIAPLPGFAKFDGPNSAEGNLVALLGFEGARFAHVLTKLEVSLANVVPIVGVPGFAAHHPFESIDGNRESLRQEFLHSQLRLAKANCPFDAFFQIYRAFRDGGWDYGRIAPIGTKPHGVGAVLFAISRPDNSELVYDHPVRKAKRSLGRGRICLYDTAAFCGSEIFLRTGDYSGSVQ